MNNKSYCLNNKSLIPAIEEAERFLGFLNERFKLKLPKDFNIFQELTDDGNRQKSRLFLFTCEGECFKIRSGIKELNVICGVCKTPFVMS